MSQIEEGTRPGADSTSRPWLALGLICSAVFCAFIAVFAIPPLMGMLTRQFHVNYSRVGLFMTAYTMIPTFGSLLIGLFSDRVGVRNSLLSGLSLLALAGFLSALSQNFWEMLACRILIGMGATTIFVPGLATVLYLFPAAGVNLATGAFFSSLNLGLSVAMLVTPIIARVLGWRAPIAFYAAFALMIAAVIRLFTNGSFFHGVRSPKNEDAAIPGRQGSKAALVLVSASNFLLFFQSFGMITWLPEYLAQQRGYPPAQVGGISMLLGLVVIPGSMYAGWLADRIGAWPVAVSGATLCAVCPALLVLTPQLNTPGVAMDIFLVALGTSLLTIPLTSVLARLVSSEHGGKAVGLILTTGYGGALVATSLGGFLLTARGSYTWTFLMCSVSMLLTLTLLAFLRRTYQRLETHSELQQEML
jgi:predicted MFS family arabinose efflux permease